MARKSAVKEAADQGYQNAQLNLGILYYSGVGGVQKDEVKAVKLFFKAAGLGHPIAQLNLAVMYYDGRGGLKKNTDSALFWMKRSADQGYSDAKTAINEMLEK